MADETFAVEVRRVEVEYGETGQGVANRTDVVYELGAMIEGAWVRFTSVPGSTVEALSAHAAANRPPDPEGPTMAEVTPTPGPQQAAVQQQGSASS